MMRKDRPTFPQAMAAPHGQVVVLTEEQMESALEQSRLSPRRRIILPFHKSGRSTLHRMFNVCQKETYIRPHWHRTPPKDESLVLLRGAIALFIFSDRGKTKEIIRVRAGTSAFGIDLCAGVCHSFVVMEADTVVFEAKPGPYDPNTDKDFATWAPEEGSAEAEAYLAGLVRQIGYADRS